MDIEFLNENPHGLKAQVFPSTSTLEWLELGLAESAGSHDSSFPTVSRANPANGRGTLTPRDQTLSHHARRDSRKLGTGRKDLRLRKSKS